MAEKNRAAEYGVYLDHLQSLLAKIGTSCQVTCICPLCSERYAICKNIPCLNIGLKTSLVESGTL